MSSQNINLFFKHLTENPEAEAKAKTFEGDDSALAAYARELGYEVTPKELRETRDKALKILEFKARKTIETGGAQSPGAAALRELMKRAETDETVAKRLEELGAGAPEALIAYGKEMGYAFTGEDLKNFGKEMLEQDDELSDEELEAAAGGLVFLLVALAATAVVGVVTGAVVTAGAVGVVAAVSEAF